MEKTKTMESLAGRSNYIQAERMMGVPDPGAFAVVFVYTLSIFYTLCIMLSKILIYII
jgi:hypothetical protein